MKLDLEDDARLLVLTGAGVSADSGVPTFRDLNGLWQGHEVERVASPEGFEEDPALVWRFYGQRRAGLRGVAPSGGHHALAEVERRLGERFLLVTQNVDGLHHDAGSQRVLELHGNILRSRCTGCDRPAFEDRDPHAEGGPPRCDRCRAAGRDSLLRPDVVWFGERLPAGALEQVHAFIRAAGRRLRFVAVGTSGVVFPAAALVDAARRAGGKTWLVNAEPAANAGSFDEVLLGRAAERLPALFA